MGVLDSSVAIEVLLTKNPDGLTVKEIANQSGLSQSCVTLRLKSMDAYIDRYVKTEKTARLAAVWMLGKEENTPYPGLSKETLYRKSLRSRGTATNGMSS